MLANLTFREPRYAALIILVIVSAGLSSLLTLGRQEDPTITNLFGTIVTPFPGADPARVEALVSIPIENKLKEIPEVSLVESTSRADVSVVSIQLSSTLPDNRIEQVWVEVRDAVEDARIEFPDGVQPPEIDTDGIGAYSAVIAILLEREDVPLALGSRLADTLADRLREIPGARVVDVFGAPEEEVLVTVDPYQAGAVGIGIGEIASRIRFADGKVLAGRLSNENSDGSLAVTGEITQLDRVRSVVLRETGNGEGLRVESLASVSRGPRVPASEIAMANGQSAVLIGVLAERGVQIDRWMGFVRAEVNDVAETLPKGFSIDILFDQSVYTVERLTEVGQNMAFGIVIVVGILLLTLGLTAALIVALVLPLVSLATIATLAAIDLPLHQMSITGLIVSLGLVVDAAIVMTDRISRLIREGKTRANAVLISVRGLAGPLAASTVTTILSFMPMVLLPGAAGDFVSAIAIAVAVMLAWSFIIAMTVTPALAGRLIPGGNSRFTGGLRIAPLARAFRWLIRKSLANPFRSVAIAFILPVLGYALAPTLIPQFFPTVERNQFYIELEMSGRASLARTEKTVREIDALLRDDSDISLTYWTVGASGPGFYYNIFGGRSDEPGFAQAMVTTTSPRATARAIPKLQAELNARFPQARIIVRGLIQGPPVAAPVELRISGQDLSVLRGLGEELQAIIADLPNTVMVRTSVTAGHPRIRFDIDEEEARRLGLDIATIAQQMELGLNGITGGSLLEGTEQVPVRVRYTDELRSNLGAISDMPIILPADPMADPNDFAFSSLPLSSIATPIVEPSKTPIFRRNGERVNLIQAFIPADVLPERALSEALQVVEDSDFELPTGYRMEVGGSSSERAETVRNLMASVGLIVTLTVATAVITFNSFRLTFGTFLVAGLSIGLSLLSLALMNFPFGINALIGVIGSVGVSINAAIIIISGLRENPAAAAGDLDAAADEVLSAGRHIFSTTLTTFGGFLPLILADGLFWPPFAVAVAGGVLLSSTVSFFYTAPMYFILFPPKKSKASAEPQSDPLKFEYQEKSFDTT